MSERPFKIGDKVNTTVSVCGIPQLMAQGIVTGVHSGYCDVDVMGLHGGAPWIQQHADSSLELVEPSPTPATAGKTATPKCDAAREHIHDAIDKFRNGDTHDGSIGWRFVVQLETARALEASESRLVTKVEELLDRCAIYGRGHEEFRAELRALCAQAKPQT